MTTATHLLEIQADRSHLTGEQLQAVALPVSPATIATRHWPQGQPSLMALERAIDEVESAIEAAGLAHADRGVLRLGTGLGTLLQPALPATGPVARDAVEAAFSRLVANAGAGSRQGAVGGESAAALLLVRELMHHLGFQALQSGD